MTPLMISSDIQNYAFLVELPADTVFTENEDIQTIQIDEYSSVTSTNLNNAVQPMIIASTDAEGNCFVTLQDEQTFNTCSPWSDRSEITGETSTSGILTTPLVVQHAAVPPSSTVTIAATVPTKTTATITSPPVKIPTTTATSTVSIPVTVPMTIPAAATIAITTTTVTTTTTTSATIRKIPVAYQAKTDVQLSTEVPSVTRIVNNRNAVGIRSFMRCGRSRMIADHLTSIPVSEFKSQLNDTSDIIGKLDLAPSTKRQMNLLQWKGIGKLFASPGQKFMSEKLMKLFTRHLRTKLLPSEETFGDMELLPVGYKPEVDTTKIKRITRRRRYPEAEEYQRRLFQEQMQQTLESLGGQTHIQTVYLDNAVGVYGNEATSDRSIIVIHNSQDTDQASAFSQQNVEVLLAAAGETGLNSDNFHQVFICNTEDGSESVMSCASSIIIVPNDPLADSIPENVVSS